MPELIGSPEPAGSAKTTGLSESAVLMEPTLLLVRPALPETGQKELIPEDLPGLLPFVTALDNEYQLWDSYIRQLSALENPKQGVFYASGLHEARQYKMSLRYKLDFCKARIKRLQADF